MKKLKAITDTQKNQKGQALLFIIVAMTVALAVGVAVSTRTLSSLRRTTSTDTSARVYAAAEGGIEFFLQQPTGVLEDLSEGGIASGECPDPTTEVEYNGEIVCQILYDPVATSTIQSRALVKTEFFKFNYVDGSDDHYFFNIEPGDVKEVKMVDASNNYYTNDLDICWVPLDAAEESAVYLLGYDQNGYSFKTLVAESGTSLDISGQEDSAPSSYLDLDYENCYTLNITSPIEGLRIKVLNYPAKVGILPSAPDAFPDQGFEIISTGELVQTTETAIRVTKTMRAKRSYPYMPSIFDYGIYSEAQILGD